MKTDSIHIYEENTQIIWGLIAIVAIGIATYTLFNAFMAASWQWAGYKQLLSMGLFILGFYGIIKISTPLYHFVLNVNENMLTIEIWRESDEPLAVRSISLSGIKTLRIAPHSSRSTNEALYDFSTSYYLIYENEQGEFQRLIYFDDKSFTLKVEDIIKIMRFLKQHRQEIAIPEQEALFMDSN